MIALLSFSNIAVDTFQTEYSALARQLSAKGRRFAVEISTMDGFITTNVLRPHGHRLMKSSCVPFLINGREGFLNGFKVWDGNKSLRTAEIKISWEGTRFNYTIGKNDKVLGPTVAVAALKKLAALGAYTHDSARYWVLRILHEEAFVLRALARRFPHIVVDEAQDIGPEHQAILELLIEAGSQVSLIGDPHQGIYEFARADGSFLREYGSRAGVKSRGLTMNYRSMPGILNVANKLTGRTDRSNRVATSATPAAYYLTFKAEERKKTLSSFQNLLKAVGIDVRKGVVLCRSAPLTAEWSGESDGQGQGVTKCFADAVISRDLKKDYHQAFIHGCMGLSGLLAPKHSAFVSQMERPADDTMRRLRRVIWSFVRDSFSGLPSAKLVADVDWHPQMRRRTEALLETLQKDFGLIPADNMGQRMAKKKLENRPLIELPDLAGEELTVFRTSTVHKVKGESLDAVLYVAKKGHVRALLDGTKTEDGRIGYVALTRARNIFVLAVPEVNLPEFEPELKAAGLKSAV